MTANEASRAALRRHARQRSEAALSRAENAFKRLRRKGAPVSIMAVAREAGVSRKVIYANVELAARIRAHKPPAASVSSAHSDGGEPNNSIVDALRRQLTVRDRTITELRQLMREKDLIIATLHGQLDDQLGGG